MISHLNKTSDFFFLKPAETKDCETKENERIDDLKKMPFLKSKPRQLLKSPLKNAKNRFSLEVEQNEEPRFCVIGVLQ